MSRHHHSNAHSPKRRLIDALDSADRKRAKKSLLKEFNNIARWIGRSEDPFIDFSVTFDIGMSADGVDGAELDSDNEENQTEIHHHLRIYALLSQRIPGFYSHIDPIQEEPDKLNALTSTMTKALGSARSDDCSSLKEKGLAYITLDAPGQRIEPMIPPGSGKANRGFTNITLARLLCPMRLLSDFDSDVLETMKKLQDGRIPVTSLDFPSFLYPKDAVYDSKNIQKGLCRGPLLVRVWRHIFTSPSSATRSAPGSGRTKSSQAKMNKMNAVTPRSIAYAALHARWMMCVQEDWRSDDGVFDKKEFFEMVVFLFEVDPEDAWCVETLVWWNKQVFRESQAHQPPLATGPSDISVFMAQRTSRLYGNSHQSPSSSRSPSPNSSSPITSHRQSSPPTNATEDPNRESPLTSPPVSSPLHAIIPTPTQPTITPNSKRSRCCTSPQHIVNSDGESELSPVEDTPPSLPPKAQAKIKLSRPGARSAPLSKPRITRRSKV